MSEPATPGMKPPEELTLDEWLDQSATLWLISIQEGESRMAIAGRAFAARLREVIEAAGQGAKRTDDEALRIRSVFQLSALEAINAPTGETGK